MTSLQKGKFICISSGSECTLNLPTQILFYLRRLQLYVRQTTEKGKNALQPHKRQWIQGWAPGA